MPNLTQDFLDEIFPATRTDEFFDALFGGAEEGAYDIRLTCQNITDSKALLAFELHQRPGKCLACNLTYGLPQVFRRHPTIDVAGVVAATAAKLGWGDKVKWDLGSTEEISNALHVVPLVITADK